VKADESKHEPPRVILLRPRSLHHVQGGVAPVDLLTTTSSAFGVTNISGASKWPFEGPEKSDADLAGPLVVAMAGERPKIASSAPRGARVVVVGTASVLQPLNWNEPIAERGAAFFVESAISWLASRPAILDVPDKPAVSAAIRITEESRSEVGRYVLIYMPLAAALLGFAVGLRRRSTEGKRQRQG
jgi:hypothetical protein